MRQITGIFQKQVIGKKVINSTAQRWQ